MGLWVSDSCRSVVLGANIEMSVTNAEMMYFNMIAEAKARALVVMAKKYRPDLKTQEELEDFLKRLVGYAVENEYSQRGLSE